MDTTASPTGAGTAVVGLTLPVSPRAKAGMVASSLPPLPTIPAVALRPSSPAPLSAPSPHIGVPPARPSVPLPAITVVRQVALGSDDWAEESGSPDLYQHSQEV